MALDDDAAQIAFGKPERSFEDDAPDALRGKEVVGQDDPVASKRRIDLHVLVKAEAEEVRHALAHVDHRKRRAGARLDDFDELRVLQRGALQLQPDLDDVLADVIGNGGFGGRRAGSSRATRSRTIVVRLKADTTYDRDTLKIPS